MASKPTTKAKPAAAPKPTAKKAQKTRDDRSTAEATGAAMVPEASMSRSPEDRDAEERQGDVDEDVRYVARAIGTERKKAGLTQGDLAQLSGVSQPHISAIEKGAWSPKLNTVMLIAEALGVDVNTLLPPSRRDESYKS